MCVISPDKRVEARVATSDEFRDLVNRCRERCLWFVSPKAPLSTREQQIEVLRSIERYGNREDFVQAKRLRLWLSQNSSERFSGL